MEKELEIRTCNTADYEQVILNEKNLVEVGLADRLDLIGAKIIRIREEEYPEHHIVFTLSLKED